MKKTIYIVLLSIAGLSACKKGFEKINTDPTKLALPDMEPVMTQVFKTTADRMEQENIYAFWEYAHIIEPANIGRYQASDDGLWNDFYMTGANNIRQLRKIYGDNPKYVNRMAIANIWECYLYSVLVGTYGPVPYTQAGKITPGIKYDDENSIYTSLLSKLKDAAATLANNPTGDKLTTDYIYGGDLTKWLRFANSLRLRIALRCQKNLPDVAVAAIKEVMADEGTLLQSEADDPKLSYGSADGSQSQYYLKYVKSNPGITTYPVMSDYAQLYFRSYKDPRMAAYFNKATVGYSIKDTLLSTNDNLHHIVTYAVPYAGAPKAQKVLPSWGLAFNTWNGANYPNSFSVLPGTNGTPVTSTSGINIVAPDKPFYFMTYQDVLFMEAEAALLGYGGKKTADQYYYAGINANFTFWGLTPAQAAAYQAQDGIKWGTSARGFNYVVNITNANIPADNFTKIFVQQWLSGYPDNGFDTWALMRRTRFVVPPPHTNAATGVEINPLFGDLPDRYIYNSGEKATNPSDYQQAVQLLQGQKDYASTQLNFAKTYTHLDWTNLPFTVILDYSMLQKWYGPNVEDLTKANVSFVTNGVY
ncbi:SusD/RagB family nutrient-binding outer membrane lipoprotein [Mucilaginibacter sabulilitoris]|uniref:SusD/RagB family nutrient-binding outer membrane lipoprotein n=1 Tax=Mucilaginibacter sabulilitoris TaxID=1173583 RepID=A0ABZ0TPP2_9SPHI|nr:SusD/RagB family nutrient-binding outer membrane lipoprotein [Mucilaginibacter sabulilitoris]WPU94746.1 SusD/RagB family nutrient-binding outer membrane lipoprotein [Mucilaginibacter sabulilitoris]